MYAHEQELSICALHIAGRSGGCGGRDEEMMDEMTSYVLRRDGEIDKGVREILSNNDVQSNTRNNTRAPHTNEGAKTQ